MPTYVPNATQATEPTESQTVESAALEFRTLKTLTNRALLVPEADVGDIPNRVARSGKLLAFAVTTGEPMVGPDSSTLQITSERIAYIDAIGADLLGANTVGTVATNIPIIIDATAMIAMLQDGIALLHSYLQYAAPVLTFPADLGSILESVDTWPLDFGLVADSSILSVMDLGSI